ncbi:hypothetical protein GCM10010987_76080 [Bradyrhizobium guangdongense]|uniref:Glycosyl transferase family 1 domain-containing protein n=2 Tax=Bradyrhizobium guangdongense TaxID=1325090 RepID=A0AA88BCK9_9BRAD|nr:hypothetical protein GCM10010987_76080 [Bradyrhizobium guangdongense]
MALGVAPIVADYAGPSELVDEDTGIRVPFVDEATLIQGFERAIQRIVNEPQLLDRLGAAAREKVLTEFTWDAKAMKIVEVYRSILSRTRIE